MTSVSFVGDELEESENVSDVMSSTRSTPHRLEPVGTTDPEYSQTARYLQRSVDGQEGDSMTTGLTTSLTTGQALNLSPSVASKKDDSSILSQHTLDELAQNISADALAVAMSELSADDEATDVDSFCPLLAHSTGDGENRDENISQYAIPDNSTSPPTQYPLSDTPEQASLTQYPLPTPSPSQYPNSSLLDKTSGRGSLTQYPISEGDLTNTAESRSKSDSSDLAMFQTRPGTVIERPETDGHNDQDDVSPVLTKAPALAPAKPAPDVSLKSMYYTSKSTFDSSIRVGHFTHSSSIGGDSMYADKTPLTSSTPNWIKNLEKGDASVTGDTFQTLQEDLFQSRGPKQEFPEANWSLKKVPTVEYVSESDRSRLLGASHSEHKPDDTKDSRTETMKARSMEFNTLPASEISPTKSDTQCGLGDDFTEQAGEKSLRSSVRSAGSPENYDVTGSIDTSVWSSTRASIEKDGDFDEQDVSSSMPNRSPTSEGLDLMRGPSPKEVLQRIAAHSPVLSTPGLSLARENASLDLYDGKGPGSTSSSGSSGEAQQRSGTDSLLHYDGRDRLSHASDDVDDNHSVASVNSSKSSSSSSKNSQARPQTVGQGSNDFQPLIPVDSTFEVSALSHESLESIEKASRTSSNVSSYHTVPSTVSAAEKFNLTSSSKSDHSGGSHSTGEKLQPAGSESTLKNSVQSTPSTSKDTITEFPEKHQAEDLSLPWISNSTNDETTPAQPPYVPELAQPDSARSSQDSKRSSLSIGATAETLNRRGSLSERVAQIVADRSTPTVSTPKQGGSQQGEVDVDAKSEVDSDVERITGEYKAILQGVSAKLASGETDNIQKMADEALKSVGQSEIVIETTTTTTTENHLPPQKAEALEEKQKKPSKTITYKYIAPPPMTMVEPSSGSETEDALDRDVRQILAKYGRRLSVSDEETNKPKPEIKPLSDEISECRSSPAGSAYSSDDSLAKRVGKIVLKSVEFGSTVSPSATTNLPSYIYDDPSRSMTLPMDLVSSNSSASEEATETVVSPAERTQAPEPREVVSENPRKISKATKEDSSSVDTLHQKVSEILESSGHLVPSDSSHYSSSRSPSRASSVDYKLLHQDLIELENNLESIKATERRHHYHDNQPQAQEVIVTPSTSTVASEYSTPKKYAWDHSGDIAANDAGRFVSTQDLPKSQPKKSAPAKTYYSAMPLNPLLTDGSVLIDVALDLIHGPEHAPYRHYTEYGSFHDSKDISGLEAAQHSPARRQIKFDDVPEAQNRSGHVPDHKRSTRDSSEPDYDHDLDEKYYSLPDSLHRDLRDIGTQNHDLGQNRSSLSDESYTVPNRSQTENQTLESQHLSRTMEDLTSPQLYNGPKESVRRSVENIQEYSLTRSADEEVSSIQEMSERHQEMQDRSSIPEAKRVRETSKRGDRESGYDQRRDDDPKPVDSYTRPDHRSQVSYTKPVDYSRDHSSYFPQQDRTRTSDTARNAPTESSYYPRESPVRDLDVPRGVETRNREALKPTGSRTYDRAISSSTPKTDIRDGSFSKANSTLPKSTSFQTPQDRSRTKADSSYKAVAEDSLVSSPVKHQPFTVFGQMQNLFTSHRDKASAAQFDDSVEMRSPLRQNFVDPKYQAASPQTTVEPSPTERLSTEQLIEKYTKKLHELERKDNAEAQRQRDQRIREELEAKLSGLSDSESSTFKQSEDELPAPPRTRLTDHLRKEDDFTTGLKDQRKSSSTETAGLKTTSPNLRPYRPAGSSELYYYVDPSAADQDCNHSVATIETVESTHTGSDDAHAPVLPQHAYGSSPNPPANVVGVYSKTQLNAQASLKPIQEYSFDYRDTEQARLSSSSSKPTSTQSRKSQKSEEKERSFSKARDWLNGTYPSKEDLTSPTSHDKSHDQRQPVTVTGSHIGKVDSSEKEMVGKKSSRSKDSNMAYRKEGESADARDRFETPKKTRASRSDDSLTRSSKARLKEYVDRHKLTENEVPASRRGYTKERDHSHDFDPPKSKPTHNRSPVDLHQLPASYDIRNDRYDPTAMFRAQRSPTQRAETRSKSPKVPTAPSKSLKKTSGRSSPSSPSRSPCRSPERMDDVGTITSFDKFYPKLDRYSDGIGEQRYEPKSPLLRPRSLETFSPLQPELDDHRDLSPTSPSRRPRSASPPYDDTANTDVLMKHANSFVSSLPAQRQLSPGCYNSDTQLSPTHYDNPNAHYDDDGREVSPTRYNSDTRFDRRDVSPTCSFDHRHASPVRGRGYGDHSYAPSTISPYSTATDRFQNSRMDESLSPSRGRHFASPDWKETRSGGQRSGSRSQPAEQLSPGIPDNAQELWEKFQKIQNCSGSEQSLDLTKMARLIEEQKVRGQTSGLNDIRSKVASQGKEEKNREVKTVRINERANQTRSETEAGPRDHYRPKEDREIMEKWGIEGDSEKRERMRQREAIQREAQEKLKRNEEEGEKLRLELEQRREKRRLEEQQREEERQRQQMERDEKLRQEKEILRLQKQREERFRQDKEREERQKLEKDREERKRLEKEREERHQQEKEREERYRKQKEIEERYKPGSRDAEELKARTQNTTNAADFARTMDRDSSRVYREQLEKEREQRIREAAERRKQEQEEAMYKEQHLDDEEQNVRKDDRLQTEKYRSYEQKDRIPEDRLQDLREREGETLANGRLSFSADKVRTATATGEEKSSQQGSYEERSQSDNRREGEGSDREQRERDDSRRRRDQRGNGGGGHGGRNPGDGGHDDPDNKQDKEDTEEDQDKENDTEEKKPRKQAWVIRDETLLSIPEDSTIDSVSSDFMTSSEIDSEGKQITRTTKRHLPADPKLLKLQQKIAKQKEKHRREWVREQKRKEKIKMLERVLVEQAGAAGLSKHRRHIVVMEESSTTLSNTLSSSGENSTLVDPADATLTDGGEDHNDHNDTFTIDDTYQKKTPQCSCHVSRDKKKSPGRSQHKDTSPRKKHSPSPEKLNSFTVHHYSPKRQKVRPPEPKFQLKEVDYKNQTNISRTKDSRRSNKENIAKERSSTKTSQTSQAQGVETRDFGATCPTPIAASPTPDGRKSAAVQTSPLHAPKLHSTPGQRSRSVETSKQQSKIPERTHSRISHSDSVLAERSHKRSQERSGERSHKRSQDRSGERSQRSRSGHRLQSPSPSRKCPLHGNRNENRNSNQIPSEKRHKSKSPGRGRNESWNENRSHNASVNRSMSPGMFTPEGSDEENRQPQRPPPKPMVKPAQAWFIPLEKEQSSRRPLGERQPSSDPHQAVHALLQLDGPDREPHAYRSSASLIESKESTPHTLQDALLTLKPEFVSRLRERQRHVALRSEERKIQAVHKEERERLFNVKRNRSDANLNAVPISEMHYRPMKRYFTHKEMKEQTEKIYQSLPEVRQMEHNKKRNDFYKTNRLRAQLYKQDGNNLDETYIIYQNSKSSSSQKRHQPPSVNPLKFATKPMKKKIRTRKPTQPKLQPKKTDNSQPNVQVTRHIGMLENDKKKEEKNEKQKKEERRKKKAECEMSLAAALARVGIAPSYAQSVGNHGNQQKALSKKAVGLLQAAQTETFTEVKTLYKFNYQVK